MSSEVQPMKGENAHGPVFDGGYRMDGLIVASFRAGTPTGRGPRTAAGSMREAGLPC